MSASYKLVCQRYDKDPSKGKVKLQTIIKRRASYKTLATIEYKNWSDKSQMILSGEPNADELNVKIKKALLDTQITVVHSSKLDKVVEYAEKRIKAIYTFNTKKTKGNALKKLKEFRNDYKKFQDINKDFTRSFYGYLSEHHVSGTANEYFTIVKYYINEAVDDKIIEIEGDPFKNITKRVKAHKYEVLSRVELDTFLNYTFTEPIRHLTQHSFKFMMYSAGMRISDFLHLSWSNFKVINSNMNIRFKMKKTNTIKETKLSLQALESLIPFMEDYKKIDLKLYQDGKKELLNLYKMISDLQEKHDNLSSDLISVDVIKDESMEAMNKLKEDWIQHVRNIKLKQEYSVYIDSYKKQLLTLEEYVYNTLVSQIRILSSSYSNDRVYPLLRGFKGQALLEETRNRATKNNYFLGTMREELDIKSPLSNHQARHVFAQRLFEAGANFHDISIELGHKSLAVTENYRKQISSEKSKDVVKLFVDSFK